MMARDRLPHLRVPDHPAPAWPAPPSTATLSTYGILTACMGIGAVVGGLVAAGRRRGAGTAPAGDHRRRCSGWRSWLAALAPSLGVEGRRPPAGRGLLGDVPLARKRHPAAGLGSGHAGPGDVAVVGRLPRLDADRGPAGRLDRRQPRRPLRPGRSAAWRPWRRPLMGAWRVDGAGAASRSSRRRTDPEINGVGPAPRPSATSTTSAPIPGSLSPPVVGGASSVSRRAAPGSSRPDRAQTRRDGCSAGWTFPSTIWAGARPRPWAGAGLLRHASRVVSSPLRRARDTAAALGPPVTVDERWTEIDYGVYDGAGRRGRARTCGGMEPGHRRSSPKAASRWPPSAPGCGPRARTSGPRPSTTTSWSSATCRRSRPPWPGRSASATRPAGACSSTWPR